MLKKQLITLLTHHLMEEQKRKRENETNNNKMALALAVLNSHFA